MKKVLLLIFFTILITSCAQTKTEGNCSIDDKIHMVCTNNYEIVCGDNNVNYLNPCVACASRDIDSWTKGKCTSKS